MQNRNKIIEYQLPRYFVSGSTVIPYLPSFCYNTNLTSFLGLMIRTNLNRGMELQLMVAFLQRRLLLYNKLASVSNHNHDNVYLIDGALTKLRKKSSSQQNLF